MPKGGAHRLAEARGGNREWLDVLQQSVDRCSKEVKLLHSEVVENAGLQSVDVSEIATMARLVQRCKASKTRRESSIRTKNMSTKASEHRIV